MEEKKEIKKLLKYYRGVLRDSGADNKIAEGIIINSIEKLLDRAREEEKKKARTIFGHADFPALVLCSTRLNKNLKDALLKNHIETGADLLKLTSKELKTMKGIGTKYIWEIENLLELYGYKLSNIKDKE